MAHIEIHRRNAVQDARQLRKENRKLKKQLAAMKQAMKFYANERNYMLGEFDEDHGDTSVILDKGDRARKAMERLK